MVPGLILAVLVGLALGALVNWLASILSARRRSPDSESEATARRPMARIIVVELVLAVLAAYLWSRSGTTLLTAGLLFYVTVFTLIAVIDIEHRLVLNVVMIPAVVIALIEVLLSRRIPALNALAGYAVAQIVVMGFYLLGGLYLKAVNARRETPVTEVAFGFGDVTLATFCGLVVGFPGVIPMLVLMVLLGGLFALLYILSRRLLSRGYRAHTPLPYGPSIILAAVLMLLWGPEVVRVLAGW